jgi:RNA polymerase sigma factor (sigma-70 family)
VPGLRRTDDHRLQRQPEHLGQVVGQPRHAQQQVLQRGDVRKVLATLDDRERDVVILRFGLEGNQPRTLEQIGKQFGLSRERVRQIERETMAKLRDPQRADALRDYLA